MDLCSSVSIWNDTLHDYIDVLRKVKVPQMGSCLCYNNEWCFRALAVANLRMHGVSRLYYTSTDLITELPGPDEANHRKALAETIGGPEATVEQLYNHKKWKPICPPEFIPMRLSRKPKTRPGRAQGGAQTAPRRPKFAPKSLPLCMPETADIKDVPKLRPR